MYRSFRYGIGNQSFLHGAGPIVRQTEIIVSIPNVIGVPLDFYFVTFDVRDAVQKVPKAGRLLLVDVVATSSEEDADLVVLIRWGNGVLALGANAGAKERQEEQGAKHKFQSVN